MHIEKVRSICPYTYNTCCTCRVHAYSACIYVVCKHLLQVFICMLQDVTWQAIPAFLNWHVYYIHHGIVYVVTTPGTFPSKRYAPTFTVIQLTTYVVNVNTLRYINYSVYNTSRIWYTQRALHGTLRLGCNSYPRDWTKSGVLQLQQGCTPDVSYT